MKEIICKRVIKRLNKEICSSCLYGADDFPVKFNTFDILSIQIQSMLMDEINPKLDDYIIDIIEDEAEKAGCDSDGLYDAFRKMLDEHYYIKKIQIFVDKM